MLRGCIDNRLYTIPEPRRSTTTTSTQTYSCAATNPRGASRPAVHNVAVDCALSHQDFQEQAIVNSNRQSLNGGHSNAAIQVTRTTTSGGSTSTFASAPCWAQQDLDPPQVTALIKRTTTVQELHLVVETHSHDFNRIHIAAAITHLPKVTNTTSPSTPAQHASRPSDGSTAAHTHQHTPQHPDVHSPHSAQHTGNSPPSHAISHHDLELLPSPTPGAPPLLPSPPRHPTPAPSLRSLPLPHPSPPIHLPHAPEPSPTGLHAQQWLVVSTLATLLPLLQQQLPRCTARELCNCAWAVAKLDPLTREPHSSAQHAPDTHAVLQQLVSELLDTGKLAAANGMELGILSWALAKTSFPDKAVYTAIHTALASPTLELDPQALSNSAWALATAGHLPPATFDIIAWRALPQVHHLLPQHLANLSWAYAKSSMPIPGSCAAPASTHASALLPVLSSTALSQLAAFECQGLSTLAWAFGTLRCRDGFAAGLIGGIAGEVVRRHGEGISIQGLANVSWACARVGVRDDGLLALVTRALAAPHEFGRWCPCSLSTVVWSVVKLCECDPPPASLPRHPTVDAAPLSTPSPTHTSRPPLAALSPHDTPSHVPSADPLPALCKLALPSIPQFSSHQLAVLLWSCARLPHTCASASVTATVDAAFSRAAVVLGSCKPQELTMLAVACVRLQHKDPDFLSRLAAVALERIGQFKPKELSNLLWVMACHQCHHRPLFTAAAAVVPPQLMFYKPEELAKLAVAFSRVPARADELLAAVAREARREIRDKFSIASVANLLGALAESGVYDAVLMDLAASRVVQCHEGMSAGHGECISAAFAKLGHRHERLQQVCAGLGGGGC